MTRPSVSSLLAAIEPLFLWAPAFAIILGTNLIVGLWCRPLGRLRWPLAAFVLLAPVTLPGASSYSPLTWGVLDTIATTMAIVSAARLPAHDALVTRRPRARFQMFFWMTVPVARFWPEAQADRAENRRRAPRLLLSAALKRLAWEPLGYLTMAVPGAEIPWPLRSAVLILYFVLSLTAAADALSALCLLLGCDIDTLFDAPLLSRSPRDFWSRRWNKFINRFALKYVALPVGRSWGPAGVIFAVFATSGVFHEYFAWGVGASSARHGMMAIFFVLQGFVVWLGTRVPVPKLPHAVGTALTFLWMTLTAPLFFSAIEPALDAFGYEESWTPFFWLLH